ncbi:hypothetical protein BDP27DRAFT_1369074 [Rhodocollybia butyracea]|uniref:Uncharacterized protein n=1 Tax=Rhodocollybia butyracea TaxID=206335 RepID=A0A9P5PHC6_9AGAR|nr:hypothetical protein BDP27DRAFT_1369074 [Rhodocollybia butyracea]
MNRIFCNPQGLAPVELQNNSSRPSFTPQTKCIVKAMEEPKESNVKTLVHTYCFVIILNHFSKYNSGIITTASSPETLISEQRMQAGPIATGDDGIACTQVTHVLSQATIKGIGDPDDANGTMKVTEKIKVFILCLVLIILSPFRWKWAPSAVATIAGTSILKELNSEWV